jgi:hypothetical protein
METRFTQLGWLVVALIVGALSAFAEQPEGPPKTAEELKLMQGFPPAADKQVTIRNFMAAPQNRWSFQRIRELQPTREIYRGAGPVSRLETRPIDLDAFSVCDHERRRSFVSQQK